MSRPVPSEPHPDPRSRRVVFTALMLLIPVLFFVLLEGGLRLAGYGDDFPLFNPLDENPDYLVRNSDVARRYFAQHDKVPAPLHDVFAADKGGDEYRIFVQGGSSAAGFPFYHGGAFSRMLEQRLQKTFADRKVKVVNTAMDAINSYTLLDLADEIIEQQPDAVLIYAGHNEYYGALGVGSTESLGQFRGLVNTYLRLRQFRTVQLLRNGLAGIAGLFANRDVDADPSTLMAGMVGEQVIPFGSSAYELGLRQFRTNIEELLSKYSRAGIPVFIATIASNERDQRPFENVFVPSSDRTAWRQAYDAGVAALRAGSVHDAVAAFTEATRLDSLAADGFYELARAREAAGDTTAALEAYIAARDRDALRFRAPEAINAIIRDVAAANGATVVEAEENIRRASPGGVIGEEYMLEHLHPTVDGYFLIADAFYDALHAVGAIGEWRRPIARDVARREVLLTPADSLVGVLRVQRMKAHWPFVPRGQSASYVDTFTVRTDFDRIVKALYDNTEPWLEATGQLALHYEQTGDIEQAIRAREAVVAAYPMFAQPYLGLGGVYLRAGRIDEAVRYFQEAASAEPGTTAPWLMLGSVELERGNAQIAIDHLDRARAIEPTNIQALHHLTVAYALSERMDEARATVQTLLFYQPDHAQGRALSDWLSRTNQSPQ